MGPPRPTTLEIDLDAAASNIRAVRRLVGPGWKIYAVIKADGCKTVTPADGL